tara:strand:+ start:6143 stop:7873 length:1731 start_codon:yes stop_codon:yes gene_type:complete
MQAKKGVSTTHPSYDAMLPHWKVCGDAADGEHAIHAAGDEYLPKLAEETTKQYDARVARTPFFNASWRTMSGLKGMLFRKDPEVIVPAGGEELLLDVDQAGTPMDVFAAQIVEKLMVKGRAGILVDYPAVAIDPTRTRADAQREGLRPSMNQYRPENIINWKVERINNETVTSLVVLKEMAAIDGEDEYSHKSEPRYRVLDLDESGFYRQRLFKVTDAGADEQIGGESYPTIKGKKLRKIAFFFVSVDDISPDPDLPPLLDLVSLNIHHYQVSADWEHACHFSGLPTLFVSGLVVDPDTPAIHIGGPTANVLPDPNALAYYVETDGNFGSISENLDKKKAEMAVLGARMLEAQKSAVESAETLQNRSAGEQSQLAGAAKIVSMALTQALTLLMEWNGSAGETKYQLNDDFMPAGLSAQDLGALVGAWQAGSFSSETLFENLKRGEIIDQKITFEDEQARIGNNPIGIEGEFDDDPLKDPDDEAENSGIDMAALIEAIKAIVPPEINVEAPEFDLQPFVDAIKAMQPPEVKVETSAPVAPVQPAPIIFNTGGGKEIKLVYTDGKVTGATSHPIEESA